MNEELLQIAAELASLQSRLLAALLEQQGSVALPATEAPMEPKKKEGPKPPNEARLAFGKDPRGLPQAVVDGILDAGFTMADVAGGVAYRKDFYKREAAWNSARRVWKWMKREGKVPTAPYNTLRKAHCKDWYIWVHDPNMRRKTWVADRIRERE